MSLMRGEDGGRDVLSASFDRLYLCYQILSCPLASHACVFSAQIFAKEELDVSLFISLLPIFFGAADATSPSR